MKKRLIIIIIAAFIIVFTRYSQYHVITGNYYYRNDLVYVYKDLGQIIPPYLAIKDVDVETFSPYYGYDQEGRIYRTAMYFYSHDKNNVYYFEKKVINADVDSFQIASSGGYAIDRNGVFYKGYRIASGKFDPESFEYLGEDFAKDNMNVYYKGEVLPHVNSETHRFYGDAISDYSTDGVNVYFRNELIENADIETFTNDGGYYGYDRNSTYYFGDVVEE